MIIHRPMPMKVLAHFCQRVGTSLKAGVDIRRIIASELERGDPRYRDTLTRVHQHIEAGGTLADAFVKTGGTMPRLVCEMVALGESTGGLDAVFLRLADHYQGQLQIRRVFLTGIAWPVLQLGMALFVIGLLIWILGLIGGTDVLGWGLVGTPGLVKYVLLISLIGCTAVVFGRAVLGGWQRFRPFQRWVMRVPVLGSSFRTVALSRIAWTMSLTFNSGMDARRALRLAIRNGGNILFMDQLPGMERDILGGNSLADTFQRAGVFPDEFLHMVAVGEESGQLAESMGHIADAYRDQAKAAWHGLAVVAGFVVWALVAAIIIFFIFRLAGFYFGMIRGALE